MGSLKERRDTNMMKGIFVRALLLSSFVVFAGCPALAKTNEIYGFKVLGQTQEAIRFEIHYFYSGDHGTDRIGLEAAPTQNGQTLGYWDFIPGTVLPGDHTTQIRVSIIPRAPRQQPTNKVQFSFYSWGGVPFFQKSFSFKKVWINASPQAGKAPVAPPPPSPANLETLEHDLASN